MTIRPPPERAPISLLAVDIDGTLVTDGDRVSPATCRAMRRADEKLAVVLATGRRYRTTQRVMDVLGLALPAVCLGGALTKTASGETLHSVPFATGQVDMLLRLAQRRALTLVLQRDAHARSGPDFVVDASQPFNTATKHYVAAGGGAGFADPAVERSGYEDILVVGCFGDHDPLAALENDIAAMAGREFETVLVPSKKTPGWYLETIIGNVSKWAALRRYAARVGVPDNAICTVGDALNDLPMIRGAAFGVAMGNADPAVKAAAAWTTGRNDEDGLVPLIDHLIG